MNKILRENKLILIFISLLLPFILYGMYKNGYLLYKDDLITMIDIFKPLILSVGSILIAIIINLIFDKKIHIDFSILYVLLLSLIVSVNVNYIVYFIVLIIFLILYKIYSSKIKFNYVAFLYLVIFLIMMIINNGTFSNVAESIYTFSFSISDILTGRNIGGISSTSIILSICVFFILSRSIYYKKSIPIIINIVYLSLVVIYYLITKDYSLIINSEVIFGSIFVSTLPISSCYSKKGILFYSILIGIITFIVALFNKVIAIYIATFLVSLIHKNIENINIKQ